ncbi:hypothetical protein QBC45DRAFT_23176 [Copromyces sp. CBS 386.78]|nr:hypothetical protein QBC45DRAFT_23176 [Copromyces sp. CBS 386.78]
MAENESDYLLSHSLCTTKPIKQELFTDQDLRNHLDSVSGTTWARDTELQDQWRNGYITAPDQFLEPWDGRDEGTYKNATYEVYEIPGSGEHKCFPLAKNKKNGDDSQEILSVKSVWDTLKEVNENGEAVGRITILQEVPPLVLGAVHMTMQKHFDMDELLKHLISNEGNNGKTKAYMDRATESTRLRQRTFFFVFKYYTVVNQNKCTPAPWQNFDTRPADRKLLDHVDIAECSSILALSLGGDPIKMYRGRVKKRDTKDHVIFATSAPWQLLSIQCFPDDEHTMRSEGSRDSRRPLCNGPFAFLDSLALEYHDAVTRYSQINDEVTKLITPPSDFMFNSELRDGLLFEDENFSYSRRYFWAYNTLGVINVGIDSMMSAYNETFTGDFWKGKLEKLWAHPDPDSEDGKAYANCMGVLRQELDREVNNLEKVRIKNEKTREEIASLRDQLFSGSSVKESRRAIEQGDNIKILTVVSMLFLPLTFVTSIFGITTLEISVDDWRFPVTLLAVCIPFFMIIFVLQTRWGMKKAKRWGTNIERYTSGLFGTPSSTNQWQTSSDYGRLRERPSTPNGNEELGERRGGRKRPALMNKRTYSGSSSKLATGSGAKRGKSRNGLLPQHQIHGGGTWTMMERMGGGSALMVNRKRWNWLMWWRNKEKTKDPAASDEASVEQV